jgi:hypothetical protein
MGYHFESTLPDSGDCYANDLRLAQLAGGPVSTHARELEPRDGNQKARSCAGCVLSCVTIELPGEPPQYANGDGGIQTACPINRTMAKYALDQEQFERSIAS